MGQIFGRIEVEVPKHEVLLVRAAYELRKYPPVVVAATSTSDMVSGDNSFGRLANFIGVFGTPENRQQAPIAMTAPVITGPCTTLTPGAFNTCAANQPGADRRTTMQMLFVLPSKFTEARKAPQPTHSDVQVVGVDWGTVACVTFSGWASAQDVAEREASLVKALQADGHVVRAKAMLARYNPPWTLGPLRTNELLIPVEVAAWVPPPSLGPIPEMQQ